MSSRIESCSDLLQIILEDVIDLVQERFSANGISEPFSESAIRDMIEYVIENEKSNFSLDKLHESHKVLSAMHMARWRQRLESLLLDNGDLLDHEALNLVIFYSFMLGVYRGSDFRLEHNDATFFFLDDIAIRDRAREQKLRAVSNKKIMLEKLLGPFIEEANEKWSNGDECYHDEMATYLLEKCPDFEHLIRKNQTQKGVLINLLKPIARKHGKVRGDKKT